MKATRVGSEGAGRSLAPKNSCFVCRMTSTLYAASSYAVQSLPRRGRILMVGAGPEEEERLVDEDGDLQEE